MHDNGDNAYLLHSRPYTDSRILVDYFCEKTGLISGVQRLPKSRRQASPGRQFVPVFVQWHGAGELKTIKSIEQIGPAVLLTADALYCGLYLNELLVRLVPKEEPHPHLYSAYASILPGLGGDATEVNLRIFELIMLEELGYGFDFDNDANGDAITGDRDNHYNFTPERGFIPGALARGHEFSGRAINAIRQRDFADPEARAAAKRLCRLQINHLLDGRPLKSRELFIQTRNGQPSDH